MSTTDLWTALLSDDPDELDGALAVIAADDAAAEIARRDVFGADPDDDPFGRGELWPDGEGGRFRPGAEPEADDDLDDAPCGSCGLERPYHEPECPQRLAERAEAAGLDADGMSEVLASDSDRDGRFDWDIDYSDSDPYDPRVGPGPGVRYYLDSEPERRPSKPRRPRDGIGY